MKRPDPLTMTMTLPTMRELRAPVGPLDSGAPDDETLETLRLALEQGGERERAAAENYIEALILKAMAAHLLAAPHGAVPMFVEQIERSVKSFDRVLR